MNMKPSFYILVVLFSICTAQPKTVSLGHKTIVSHDNFIGCPLNNDFYYHGTINSPLYPLRYPPNDRCFYFITAEPGKVLQFTFDHYDVQTCCDYVTIYDGPTITSDILVQIGGPNGTITKPNGPIYSSTGNAVVTFNSDAKIQQTGFSMQFTSVDTASPCNRDILLMMNGLADVGSQQNFVEQLHFFSRALTRTWEVALDKIRVMINLQVDMDYGLVWTADDLSSNERLTNAIDDMTDNVPDVLNNNNTDLECFFRYAYNSLGDFGRKSMDERYGIEQVAIVFVASNGISDQDYYEAHYFAHKIRTEQNTKVIVIGVGENIDVQRISDLAFAPGYAFFVKSYDRLNTLIPSINKAICNGLGDQCGP